MRLKPIIDEPPSRRQGDEVANITIDPILPQGPSLRQTRFCSSKWLIAFTEIAEKLSFNCSQRQ